MQKIGSIAGFKPAICGLPNRGAMRYTFHTSLQQFCRHEVYASRAVSEKGKKTTITELIIFLSKNFFDGE